MTSTGHVEDVVYRWLGSDSTNPEESALERLAENLRSRGILFEKVAERRFLKFFTLRSKTYHVSTPFVSIALGPLGDSGAIGRCKASRPGLYRLLLREVRTAFARRQRTYDSWD
jgi:hypothetical protein